jgi:hypothetical protein
MPVHTIIIRGNGTFFVFDEDSDCFCCRYECSPFWWFRLCWPMSRG